MFQVTLLSWRGWLAKAHGQTEGFLLLPGEIRADAHVTVILKGNQASIKQGVQVGAQQQAVVRVEAFIILRLGPRLDMGSLEHA